MMNKTQVCGVCRKISRVVDSKSGVIVCIDCDSVERTPQDFRVRLQTIQPLR